MNVSYEAKMLKDLRMPSRQDVEEALLKSMFKHNGAIKEFGIGQEIVEELANDFNLNEQQRSAQLETIYRKENRIKKSSLWHRLLFRAADNLAKEKLLSRPTQTALLSNKKEWMLTEAGYDYVLNMLKIPLSQKDNLPIKSYEVEKLVKKISSTTAPLDYLPIENIKRTIKITKELKLRSRVFRQAIIEAYEYKCAVCGMKLCSPNNLSWEVEAAHIVPHTFKGKDDIWNGIALCRLHHWSFDVGWFSLEDSYNIIISSKIQSLPGDFGNMYNYNFIEHLTKKNLKILLPSNKNLYPHINAISWHRENVLYRF